MVEEVVEGGVEIKTPADKFHMFVRRSQHLPKATRNLQGCDLLQGEWGEVGSIALFTLVFDGEERMSKDRIVAIDVEKNVIQWIVLEGPVKKDYKSFLKTMKVIPKEGGSGSVVKWNFKYEKIDEKVASPKRLLQFLLETTKEVDMYLSPQE